MLSQADRPFEPGHATEQLGERPGQRAPFHENFWTAASTAAPVITLAIVVVIPDAAGVRFRGREP